MDPHKMGRSVLARLRRKLTIDGDQDDRSAPLTSNLSGHSKQQRFESHTAGIVPPDLRCVRTRSQVVVFSDARRKHSIHSRERCASQTPRSRVGRRDPTIFMKGFNASPQQRAHSCCLRVSLAIRPRDRPPSSGIS